MWASTATSVTLLRSAACRRDLAARATLVDQLSSEYGEQFTREQAEHGADSFVCLVAPSLPLCKAVLCEVDAQLQQSQRASILRDSLATSLALCVDSMEEACELCDLAAAEHYLYARFLAGTTGDPLDVRSVVRHLFIRGQPVDLDDRHSRLYEQFKARPKTQ